MRDLGKFLLQSLFAAALLACGQNSSMDPSDHPGGEREATESLERERKAMVREQIAARGIEDPEVLQAMRTVPRHKFVAPRYQGLAYSDRPLPIGHDQTISQPYIVALMTELLELQGGENVLEIGTGCGYQTAVLAELDVKVYSMEIVAELCDLAERNLSSLGYTEPKIACRSGYDGWPEHAPFDAILVAAAPERIPQALIDQLKVGGRLVIPVGGSFQELVKVVKTAPGEVRRERIAGVRFVPMVRE